MSVNLVDGKFSADYFALREDNQPVCTDQFLLGLQVLATQATSAINNPKAVEQAFERIQEAKWELKSSEAKNDVDQKIQDVRQKWVKVCFGEQFRHVPREHLEKNCGPKFQTQYTSKMKEATEPMLELLPPDGVTAEKYDKTIVNAFLDYIQTGTLSEDELNASILDLLSLAHQHQIEGLITKCTEFLKEQFDDHENLDTVWEVANKQKIPQLTFACLSYMQANRDKISKELTGKFAEILPVVKALIANEIKLYQSPSGIIDVKVMIFNKKTASHIEQLIKLFTIRSLVISENRSEKRLNNVEKLFSFLKEISPKLKDLQELIIWNETPKENDFLTLKDLFPKLTAYGNDAPFLDTFEDVKEYLINFRNPDEIDPVIEKLVLRSLNLSSLFTFDNAQLEEIAAYLQELHHIVINSYEITSVAAPKATMINFQYCTALTTIDAPEVIEINCQRCIALKIINAPEATGIHCQDCITLTSINAPKATKICCKGCTDLKTIEAPKAIEFHCEDSTALKAIKAPKATKIYCKGCTDLKTIEAPKAIEFHCECCTALKSIKAPKAAEIHCQLCKALTSIKAPEANKIYCLLCTALKTIKAPKSAEIHCPHCKVLTTIKAPNATEIYCEGCVDLKTIKAPEATVIHCQDCTTLTTVKAPELTKIICSKCTSLTTIEIPKATEIYCPCSPALTTIEAPKATKIYCQYCTALTTINAPKATEINCMGCTSLTTIDAPNATVIFCGGSTSITAIDAPKALDVGWKFNNKWSIV